MSLLNLIHKRVDWNKKSREAYLIKNCSLWCSDIFSVPEDKLKIRLRRVNHKRSHSVIGLTLTKSGDVPRKLSFVVPFDPKNSNPSFIRLDEYEEASGKWQTIIDNSIQKDEPEIIEPANSPALPSVIAYLLLIISLFVCIYSGAAAIRRIASFIEGISAYTWTTVDGKRGYGWYTYSFIPPGKSQTAKSSRYDVFMRNRGGREFGIEALNYARLSAIHTKPVKVYVNPEDPARSVLDPGISPIAAAQFLVILAALIPSLLSMHILIAMLWGFKVPEKPSARIGVPFLFYLLSFGAAMLYMSIYSYVLRTMPPAMPMAIWGVISGLLFLLPNLARRLYAIRMVRRGVYFVIVFGFFPPLAIVIGLALPYVLALTAGVMALTVLLKPFARANRKPLYALLISLFWVPVYTAGLLAPCRAFIQILHEVLPYMPYNLGLTSIENPRFMAFLDVGVGLAGIIVCLLLTYSDSLWRGKQAGLVEALPTSKAGSVALGLIELQGRAVHKSSNQKRPVLQYHSRDLSKTINEPFYLEDKSGRILIDPSENRFRTKWRTSLGGRIIETVLTKREQKPDLSKPHIMKLLPGDPVYIIGTAELKKGKFNKALGSDRLVVKRRSGGVFNSPLWQISQGRLKPGHEIQDVFFLTDDKDQNAKSHIMRGMWQVWFWALVWILLGFLMFHFQLARTEPGYTHWTMSEIVKYTSGKERLKAVLAYLNRQPKPLVSPVQQYIEPVPVIGPIFTEINFNQQIAQLSVGTNLLWRNKFPNATKQELEILLKALKSRSWDARWWAASRLKGAVDHHHRVVPALIDVLRSEDDVTIRVSAASSLKAFGLHAIPAVPALVNAARSSKTKLQNAALWTLARMPGITGGPAYELFTELLSDPKSSRRSLGVQGMRSMGTHAGSSAALLLELTSDESQNIRSLALGALHKIAPDFPGFTERVVKSLSDHEAVVRHSAVYIVNEMSEPPIDVAKPLGKMITDKSVNGRINYILSTMGPRAAAAIPYVAEALGSDDGKTAYYAAFILSRVGKAAAPALKEMITALKHKDRFVRRYSAQALGNIGIEASIAIPHLQSLFTDKDKFVRNTARQALYKLKNR